MAEPITIGTLVASALGMAAEAALKSSVGEAAKEAYQALKGKITKWTGTDLDLLEKEPASKGRQTIVAENLDRQSEGDQAEMRDLAQRLIAMLKEEALKEEGGVALDVDYLEAMEVQLGNISVVGGVTGARFRDARISGAFRIGDIKAGGPSGKI
jgi:hypothetical protein